MEFRVLGPVGLWRDEELMPITGEKQRTLLALLVLEANKTVSIERLVTALWGMTAPATARKLLYNNLWSVRRLLTDSAVVVSRPKGYSLQLQPGASDLDVFRIETAQARSALADGDYAQASQRLHQALSLWRGPALGGTHPDFQAAEGPALEELYLTALNDRIEVDLVLDRHGDLVSELRLLVCEHPLNEKLRGQLMRVLHRLGRTAEALQEFHVSRRLFREELGIDPGKEIADIHQAILTGDSSPSLDAVRFTPASPAIHIPRQLPVDIIRFTGREHVLKELDVLLTEEGADIAAMVISAIAGTAGVGKTALATRWGHRVSHLFPDGQLYVNLHGYSQSAPIAAPQALHLLLRGLGVATESIPQDMEEKTSLYRSIISEKRLLLILDNAKDPEQVRSLLPGSSSCKVLITSRDSLRGLAATHDVHTIRLDILADEEAQTLMIALLGEERVANDVYAVAEITRLCGRLPLAIRIASAQLVSQPSLTTREFADRLRNGNRLIDLEFAEDPQTGVRAAFELSYQNLIPAVRRIFRLMGLHPGPDISIDAIAALAGLSEEKTSRLVDALINAHLAYREDGHRISMHDLISAYAHDRSESEDSDEDQCEALSRLFDWYLRSADTAIKVIFPGYMELDLVTNSSQESFLSFDDYDRAFSWVESEHRSMVSVITYAGSHGWLSHSWQLSLRLARFYFLKGYTDDWLTTHRVALSSVRQLKDKINEAKVLSILGFAFLASDTEGFLAHQKQAATLYRDAGDVKGEADALGKIGIGLLRKGELSQAAEAAERALFMHQSLDNSSGEAFMLSSLAVPYLRMGRLSEALECLHKSIEVRARENIRFDESIILSRLGEVYSKMGSYSTAMDYQGQAIRIARETKNFRYEAEIINNIGVALRGQGNYVKAIEYHQKALGKISEFRDWILEVEVLNSLGETFFAAREFRESLGAYRSGLDIAIKFVDRYQEGVALRGIGDAMNALGEVEEAAYYRDRAAVIFSSIGVL
ncbi:AfsR/SARP family transcriptional regulator [Streptosporangium roseum]|uniref:AfsR/SARP family transcriptional regulator n=1 Tax=Streptosporangium roseum TaxID=2001 RepID=UPI0033166FE1